MGNLLQTVPLLYVTDVERSVAFYQHLGFELTSEWRPDGKLAWCWLAQGGAALMLQLGEQDDVRPISTVFYFLCESVDVVHRELLERGFDLAVPTIAFYGMRQLPLRDPDGYSICFESAVNQGAEAGRAGGS